MTPLETHAKNLAWIDGRIVTVGMRDCALDLVRAYIASLTANRKVLERHAPEKHCGQPRCENNYVCTEGCLSFFPCPTYTDVQEGLGIKE